MPRKLAMSRKLLKKPTYVTLAGIQRMSRSSTKRRVALVRSNRTPFPEREASTPDRETTVALTGPFRTGRPTAGRSGSAARPLDWPGRATDR
jgi:hypothetical protein